MLKSKIILGFSGEGFPRFVSYEEKAPYISTSTNPVLRRRAERGLGVSCGRLPGLREVAQGPAGQAAVIRRSHALSESGRSFEGDDPADGGDRPGHTGLADRV